jgi:hypothetical protein
MHPNTSRFAAAVTASALLAALTTLTIRAQQAPAPASPTGTRPADEVLAQLGRSADVVILADATVQGRLPISEATATRESVEQQLAALVRRLPAGTTWIKLYAPAPANGRWDVAVVEEYARAQSRLVGSSSRPAPAGMVEVLGRQVPTEKASEAIATLNLKLVYLVTNPRSQSAPNAAASGAELTQEQQSAAARQEVHRLLAMDPASRLAALRQLMERGAGPQDQPSNDPFVHLVLKMVSEQLPEEEVVQLKQSLGGK